MDKRQLHHIWTGFRRVKPWYFLLIAVISGATFVYALRSNNLHMLKLRNAVFAADKNNADVQKPLQNLQAYVTTHMGTNLETGTTVYPPIQLEYTYKRLVQAQVAEAARAKTPLYSEAQAYCEQQNPTDFSGRNRVPCIQEYVQSHNTAQTAHIPDSLYKFAFHTPTWSPDLAGWSLLVAILSGLAALVTWVLDRWFRRTVA